MNEIYKMGFINQLSDFYSNLYNFGYFFQSQKRGLVFTKPSLNEGSSAKQDLLPFLRYNQTTSTYNNPTGLTAPCFQGQLDFGYSKIYFNNTFVGTTNSTYRIGFTSRI